MEYIKYALLSLAIMSTASCGQVDRVLAKYTGDASSVCQDGVLYLQFTSGASVAYNTDGSIKTCTETKG